MNCYPGSARPCYASRLIARCLSGLFVLLTIGHASAQSLSEHTVSFRSPTGVMSVMVDSLDDDGDGISNGLEIDGYVYSSGSGLQPWNGDPNVAHFVTDPRSWSTDGDPYSDYMEVTGVNMPGGVLMPYAHPLVAARPVISMYMVDYDVIPMAEITDSDGGSLTNAYTNTTTSEDQVGGSVSVSASLNPLKLVSAEVSANYSHTWSTTESSTNTSETNWETATTTNTSEAARLKIRVYMENTGSADASDVRPTFNLMIGRKVIATITSPQAANILSPLGSSRYPANGGIVIDKDDSGNDIILSMDELRAIERGAPISLVVTQVEANVIRWNRQDEQWNSEITWAAFENQIDPVTMTIQADVGNGDRASFQVFAGTQYYDPGFTFGDIFSLLFDVEDSGSTRTIEGRPYPDLWYLTTNSPELIDSWNAAGQPGDMWNLPARERTFLSMVSPPLNPDPTVNLATFSRDLRSIVVSAAPSGGFPILSVRAHVKIGGIEQDIDLIRPDGFPFFVTPQPFPSEASASGTVVVTDASGESVTHPIAVPFRVNDTCLSVASGPSRLPKPGGEYTLFINGDLDQPALAWCTFYSETGSQLATPKTNFWIDRSTPDNVFLMDVKMTDANTAVAVGGNAPNTKGVVYRTADRGRTWTSLETEHPLKGVDFAGDGIHGTAVGETGTILLTSDGGKTWRPSQSSGMGEETLHAVLYVSPDTVFVFGDANAMSTDGGSTFSTIEVVQFFGARDAAFNPKTRTIVVAGYGESYDVCRSTDIGVNWDCVKAGYMLDVTQNGDSAWVVTGDGADMVRSDDDGVTWTHFDLGNESSLDAVQFIGERTVLGLRRTQLYRSDDAGATWTETESAVRQDGGVNLERMSMFNANIGIAVGDAGHVVFTSSGGGMPVTTTGTEDGGGRDLEINPSAPTLSQNYPNPFVGETTLGFDLPQTSTVSLAVFDLLGRKVSNLISDEALPAGRHEFRFDGGRLAPGVYFYRLRSGDASVTKRMVVAAR